MGGSFFLAQRQVMPLESFQLSAVSYPLSARLRCWIAERDIGGEGLTPLLIADS
jgi:hypothetical protein